jgi:LysR family hydrogen peroxide-inducible transcriptional activator
MLPTLRQLQYLKLLAEHASFSRAAEAAHVTQPTLSAGIRELERALGGPVVDRARAGVLLTSLGEAAASRGAAVLAQVEDLMQAARTAGRPLEGRFRLGVIPTVAPFVLPLALPEIRRRHPELKLFLREDLTGRLIADLKSGGLDAALIALPYDTAGLDCASVAEDELSALLPEGHPLARERTVSSASLAGEDIILLEDGHCLREHALAGCGVPAPRGEDSFAASSLQTLVQMVGSGLGVSFVPQMAVDSGLTAGASVSVRPLECSDARRKIVVAWRAGSSRGVEARLLADALAAVTPQLAKAGSRAPAPPRSGPPGIPPAPAPSAAAGVPAD